MMATMGLVERGHHWATNLHIQRNRETIKVFFSIHKITNFNKEEEKDGDFDDEIVRKQLHVKCLTWAMLMFKHLEQVFLSKS
jgi:hypothetical protein